MCFIFRVIIAIFGVSKKLKTFHAKSGLPAVLRKTTLCLFCDMSRVVRKTDFCICENKDADQLRGNREANQRLCFHNTDSIVPLLPKSEI